jgi:predicted DNA binding CopG/RHH family protein
MKLTQEEKNLLDSVERGERKRIPDFQREAARYRDAARASPRKDKRVNIRMAERDLVRFQKAAVHEGLCATRWAHLWGRISETASLEHGSAVSEIPRHRRVTP